MGIQSAPVVARLVGRSGGAASLPRPWPATSSGGSSTAAANAWGSWSLLFTSDLPVTAYLTDVWFTCSLANTPFALGFGVGAAGAEVTIGEVGGVTGPANGPNNFKLSAPALVPASGRVSVRTACINGAYAASAIICNLTYQTE
jgi:hypothetical protein